MTDHDRIVPVLNAFNKLRGDYVSNGPHGCGSPAGIQYTYAVTFHWPRHTLIVDAGAALCGTGRGLTRDGTKLPQTLQDDTALDDALEAAYRA